MRLGSRHEPAAARVPRPYATGRNEHSKSDDFKAYLRNWPGNQRSDLTHLLAQPSDFPIRSGARAAPFEQAGISYVAAVDAGGCPLGGGSAWRLAAGVVLIRKHGRVDWELESASCYDPSGKQLQLELARDTVSAGDRVIEY